MGYVGEKLKLDIVHPSFNFQVILKFVIIKEDPAGNENDNNRKQGIQDFGQGIFPPGRRDDNMQRTRAVIPCSVPAGRFYHKNVLTRRKVCIGCLGLSPDFIPVVLEILQHELVFILVGGKITQCGIFNAETRLVIFEVYCIEGRNMRTDGSIRITEIDGPVKELKARQHQWRPILCVDDVFRINKQRSVDATEKQFPVLQLPACIFAKVFGV